jgi:hypothetical protein
MTSIIGCSAAYAVWKNTPQEVAIAKKKLIIRPEKQFYFALSASNCVLLNFKRVYFFHFFLLRLFSTGYWIQDTG